MKYVIATLFLLALVGCKSTSNLTVVDGFNAEKYMGTWHEAARYPHRFEKGMSNVSATYSLNEDGTIKVVNRGFVTNKKQWKDITGVAKLKKSPDQGWLKVSFFKPFYASYKIIYLDDEYTKAVVTGPSFNYLWILSREQKLPANEIQTLIDFATARGFDENKIQIVNQDLKQ